MVVIIAMQSYVSKRTPKNIRGMIFAVIGIASTIGNVLYLEIYNYLSVKFAQYMAFGVVAGIDLIMLIFVLIMIFLKKYGQPAAGTDEGEDAEEMDLKGADLGIGNYNDIPVIEEDPRAAIYDEKILEADEEYEVSTRKGSILPKVVKKDRKGSLHKGSINPNDNFDDEEDDEGYV